MKKHEFLSELKEALEHNMDEQKIKGHVEYYDEYIQNEVKSGRSEEEVVNELGDPWAIAKTIRLSEGMDQDKQENTYTTTEEETPSTETKQGINWKGILVVIVLCILVFSLFSALMGILGLAIRYAFPILIVVLVMQIMKRR